MSGLRIYSLACRVVRFALVLLILALALLLCSSCGIGVDPSEEALDILDDAIDTLGSESANWRTVLEESLEELTDEAQATIRNEVSLTLNRAIDAAGANVLCVTNNLRDAVRSDLIRIRAELLGQEIPPRVPYVCHANPPSIDATAVPEHLRFIEFFGYDFDIETPFEVWMQNGTEEILLGSGPTDGGPLDNPSHYQMTLNLSGIEFTPQSRRLLLRWQGEVKHSVGISPPPPPPTPVPTFTEGSIQFYVYWNTPQDKARDTGIPTSKYDCGIVGMWADKGDIDEDDRGTIIYARMYPQGGRWYLRANFNTEPGKHETWPQIHVMCLDKDLDGIGYQLIDGFRLDGKEKSTGIRTSDWYCGVVGMVARNGDIESDGTVNEILVAYMKEEGDFWKARANFATDSGKAENWELDVLCVVRDETLFFWDRIPSLVDNKRYSTDLHVSDYTCGIVGMEARNGDIDEIDEGEILVVLAHYLRPDGTWQITTNFNTHNGSEDWTIYLLCPRGRIAEWTWGPYQP